MKKDSLLQEVNVRLAEQIPKTSSEPEQILKESHNGVIGGVSGLEKEIIVMDSQSDTQKKQKTGLPPMKLRLLDMDEVTKHESSRNVGHPAMTWTFAMVVTVKSVQKEIEARQKRKEKSA
ncbi:1468_t:CDS:2 [Acaulospora morrowiae]|uniref:1468_t:CDS:1 n=1 Tax=Acaulospora morrowiae TaxID=94023 RepID=A0A9N9GEW4_9GLOM|nr:1468_t:CDS:2 [Acaulospora morrowiae]